MFYDTPNIIAMYYYGWKCQYVFYLVRHTLPEFELGIPTMARCQKTDALDRSVMAPLNLQVYSYNKSKTKIEQNKRKKSSKGYSVLLHKAMITIAKKMQCKDNIDKLTTLTI